MRSVQGVLKEQRIEVPYSSWYSSDGDEQSAGDYSYGSKRWRELHLQDPFDPTRVKIEAFRRAPWQRKAFSLPGGVPAKPAAPD